MVRSLLLVFAVMLCGCADADAGPAPARSAVVSSGVLTGTPIRASLPLQTPFNNNVIPAAFLSTTGGPGSTLGLVVQIPMLPVGATILRLDARVRDSVVGPTTVFLYFGDQVDNGFQEPAIQPGTASAGIGGGADGKTFQTISLPNINRVVSPFHVYYAGIALATGGQPVAVSAIDVTYLPPPAT